MIMLWHVTYAATSGDSDLDGVPAGVANVLEIEWLMGWRQLWVLCRSGRRRVRRHQVGVGGSSVDGKGVGVDRDGHVDRPVGVHRHVFMVEALQLKL